MNTEIRNAIKSFVFTYLLLNYKYSDEVALNYPEKLTDLTKEMMNINLEFKLSDIDKRFEDIIYDIESSILSKTDFENVKKEYNDFVGNYLNI
jgi:hypothetical protein